MARPAGTILPTDGLTPEQIKHREAARISVAKKRAKKKRLSAKEMYEQFVWANEKLRKNLPISIADVPEEFIPGFLLFNTARSGPEGELKYINLYSQCVNKMKDRQAKQKAFEDDGKEIILMIDKMIEHNQKQEGK